MKTTPRSLCSLLLGLLLFPSWVGAYPAENTILAVVNGDSITSQDVRIDDQDWAEESECQKNLRGVELEQKISAIRWKTFDRLIESRLIIQEFWRENRYQHGGKLPQDYANEEIQRRIKGRFHGQEALLRADLAAYGETLDELRAIIANQSILTYMTSENVDKKVTAANPADVARERETLRQAWIASLRAKAAIEIL